MSKTQWSIAFLRHHIVLSRFSQIPFCLDSTNVRIYQPDRRERFQRVFHGIIQFIRNGIVQCCRRLNCNSERILTRHHRRPKVGQRPFSSRSRGVPGSRKPHTQHSRLEAGRMFAALTSTDSQPMDIAPPRIGQKSLPELIRNYESLLTNDEEFSNGINGNVADV